MSLSSWFVAGVVPGVERQPLKKLQPDEDQLRKLMYRWRHEALQAGHAIERVVVAYEAGRDGFWLVRWLRERGVEAYVMHSSSIGVSREHRRAKTDRLDTELLMRAFLGWLRGEGHHLFAPQLLTQNHLLGGVHPMKLENMFRRIHANSANLFHGRSPLFEICNDLILAQSMPSGAVHSNTHYGRRPSPT